MKALLRNKANSAGTQRHDHGHTERAGKEPETVRPFSAKQSQFEAG